MVQPFFTPLHPVQLEGFGLILQPLQKSHEPGLAQAASDGELWKLAYTSVPAPDQEASYIEQALEQQALGNHLVFTVKDAKTKQIIGSTRYHDIQAEVARLDIGYTWYAQSVQRTSVNTTAKYLLLFYAFESLKANVVGWRTDILNIPSQKAIERLGAVKTGIISGNRLNREGHVSDTVYYRMLKNDWPEHKARLLAILKGNAG